MIFFTNYDYPFYFYFAAVLLITLIINLFLSHDKKFLENKNVFRWMIFLFLNLGKTRHLSHKILYWYLWLLQNLICTRYLQVIFDHIQDRWYLFTSDIDYIHYYSSLTQAEISDILYLYLYVSYILSHIIFTGKKPSC